MTTRTTIDGAGRIVIPKALRDELALAPGDTIEMDSAGESITLRPARGEAQLTLEKGFWVLRSGQPIDASTVENILNQIRAERDRQNLGVQD